MKKLFAILTVLGMTVSLSACHVTNSKSETTTVTDASGNTTTTTTTVTTESGSTSTASPEAEETEEPEETEEEDAEETAEAEETAAAESEYPEGSCGAATDDGEVHKVSVSIENTTGGKIIGFYACQSGDDEWNDLFGEDQYLDNNKGAKDFLTISYNALSMAYDFGIEDEDGNMHEFDDIDISSLDADGFAIEFTVEDGEYTCHIDESYIMK